MPVIRSYGFVDGSGACYKPHPFWYVDLTREEEVALTDGLHIATAIREDVVDGQGQKLSKDVVPISNFRFEPTEVVLCYPLTRELLPYSEHYRIGRSTYLLVVPTVFRVIQLKRGAMAAYNSEQFHGTFQGLKLSIPPECIIQA